MSQNSANVWYFAYGSNMSTEKFTGSRGVKPIASARVWVPNYVLAMEIPGIPYWEPSYGSLRQRNDAETEDAVKPDVVGVAYLLTAEQYRQVIASEGGQIAYRDISITGKPVERKDELKLGTSDVVVQTLGSTTMARRPEPAPSKRYMDLLMKGAEEAQLPVGYREYLAGLPRYNPPTKKWTKLGAFIYLAIVRPVWSLLDKITHTNTGADGNVPTYIAWLVRSVIFLVWLIHDWIFAPIFGPGDGRDESQRHILMYTEESEKVAILVEEKVHSYGTI